MKNNTSSKIVKITGFTLLEVMVALMIFSIGLLGLAGLQASGFSSNKTADLRGHAIILAYDIAERIRANDRGKSGDYNAIALSTAAGSAVDCISAACTTTNAIALVDLYEWKTSIAKALPGAKASVTRATANDPFTITIMWDEDRTGATGEGCDPTDTDDLKCFKLEFLP